MASSSASGEAGVNNGPRSSLSSRTDVLETVGQCGPDAGLHQLLRAQAQLSEPSSPGRRASCWQVMPAAALRVQSARAG